MAEEKKDDKKPAPAPTHNDPFAEIVSIIIALMVGVYILNSLIASITSSALFSHGWSGLTPQGIILSHTRPIASLANPIGTRIVTLNDTSVFSSPGGDKTGTQKFNARGKIVQGPVTINGVRYWYVDYDSGPDGWVAENDIAYLESEPNLFERTVMRIGSIVPILKLVSVLLSVLFIFWIISIVRNIGMIRKNQKTLLNPEIVPAEDIVNPKWLRILAHIESQNENDWRLAIMEADIMLDDILDKLSLPGETMGEKMKAIEKSDFTTIDNAWEAHKVRNQIAHEGSDFQMTQREARRIIELYRTVFEEFQII